ncbi:MAG: UbiA family prenyltransferase, partial [Luteibaculum sp.]
PVLGGSALLNSFNPWQLLPASAMGLLSVSVLNVNNLRDLQEDKKNGKRTIPVILGMDKAKSYHALLVGTPFLLVALYFAHLEKQSLLYMMVYSSAVLLFPAARKVILSSDPEKMEKQLKFHALGTAAFGIILALVL